jgi:hypothetical protein
MTSETSHSDSAYESVRVGHLESGLWYEIGCCYSRLSNVDIVYLVKQTQGMIKMSKAQISLSYELLLRDMVLIEVLKFESSKYIVDRVCYGVLARSLEVTDRVCAVHVIQRDQR